MRQLLVLLALLTASAGWADVSGKWIGIAMLGPSKIAQSMDSDALLKLQMSKAFLKSLRYEIELKADGTFVATVNGADIERRKSFGIWKEKMGVLTLITTNENGAKVSRSMTAKLDATGKRWLVVISSKPGLPVTKLVFARIPAPVKKAEPTKPTRV
ncbi:MAG: hypothetical protein WCK51_00220 [Armatimonadota bacterium]